MSILIMREALAVFALLAGWVYATDINGISESKSPDDGHQTLKSCHIHKHLYRRDDLGGRPDSLQHSLNQIPHFHDHKLHHILYHVPGNKDLRYNLIVEGLHCHEDKLHGRRSLEWNPVSIAEVKSIVNEEVAGNNCMVEPYKVSLVSAGYFHFGFVAEPACGSSTIKCECPTLFLYGKQIPREDKDILSFIQNKLQKFSKNDLEDDHGRLCFGEFPLSTLLETFHNADFDGEKTDDLETFNCATALVKMLGELGIDATDKKVIDLGIRSLLSEEHRSGLVGTRLDTEVNSYLEAELGLVVVDTFSNEYNIIEECVSTYIHNHI